MNQYNIFILYNNKQNKNKTQKLELVREKNTFMNEKFTFNKKKVRKNCLIYTRN